MKKTFFNIILVFCLGFMLCACSKQKTIILFNQNPITKENLTENPNTFRADKRFYYIFISEKPLETPSIRVRIFKRDAKAYSKITKLVYSNDFRLSKDEVYYYTDYFVMNEAGQYCMFIYATNNLKNPLAVADFKITN